MNFVGWLFVFMNGLENKPALKTPRELKRVSRSHPMAADTPDSPTVEEHAAIRALFELLATWDQEGRRDEYGNRSESRPSERQSSA